MFLLFTYWLIVLIVVMLTVSVGLLLYIPGLFLSMLTRIRWFEEPGAQVIGAAIMLTVAAFKTHIEETGTNDRECIIDEQE